MFIEVKRLTNQKYVIARFSWKCCVVLVSVPVSYSL